MGRSFWLTITLLVSATALPAVSSQAATGTMTVTPNATAVVTKSSNITGIGHIYTGSKAVYTATFPSLTNNQSGYIDVDMVVQGKEYFCDATFVTIVKNGVCQVQIDNEPNSRCTFVKNSVNTATCDFNASFTDHYD